MLEGHITESWFFIGELVLIRCSATDVVNDKLGPQDPCVDHHADVPNPNAGTKKVPQKSHLHHLPISIVLPPPTYQSQTTRLTNVIDQTIEDHAVHADDHERPLGAVLAVPQFGVRTLVGYEWPHFQLVLRIEF